MAKNATTESQVEDAELPEMDDIDEVTDETVEKARLVVAAHSQDADDCRLILDMLGIGSTRAEIETE